MGGNGDKLQHINSNKTAIKILKVGFSTEEIMKAKYQHTKQNISCQLNNIFLFFHQVFLKKFIYIFLYHKITRDTVRLQGMPKNCWVSVLGQIVNCKFLLYASKVEKKIYNIFALLVYKRCFL